MFSIFYYLDKLCVQHQRFQSEFIALVICDSDFPAAIAFSIKASEIAELEPRAIKSPVNGIPSLPAISFTFS